MEGFENLINKPEKILVKFGADWCGPCKILDRTLDSMIKDGAKNIVKIDVEKQMDLARKYNIRNVPTMIVFAGGLLIERVSGIRTENQIKQLLL